MYKLPSIVAVGICVLIIIAFQEVSRWFCVCRHRQSLIIIIGRPTSQSLCFAYWRHSICMRLVLAFAPFHFPSFVKENTELWRIFRSIRSMQFVRYNSIGFKMLIRSHALIIIAHTHFFLCAVLHLWWIRRFVGNWPLPTISYSCYCLLLLGINNRFGETNWQKLNVTRCLVLVVCVYYILPIGCNIQRNRNDGRAVSKKKQTPTKQKLWILRLSLLSPQRVRMTSTNRRSYILLFLVCLNWWKKLRVGTS